jgi:hypothetical protein
MDTYNLWSVSNKNYNRVVEVFGEDDAKTIVDVVNKTYELLFDDGPLTLEEQVIELESYENSYLYTVINDDHGVFVAATVDDTIYMVLMGFKTGSKDKFGKRFEEFCENFNESVNRVDTNSGNETNIITLGFSGLEYEYEVINFDGERECFGGIYCDCIEDIQIEIDDERIEDEDVLEHLDGMHQMKVKSINLSDDVVGIRRFENDCYYTCDIEVKGEFDPNKLTLNVGWFDLVVCDDTISTDVALFSVTYDGKEFELEFNGSEGNSSEMIWGYDPDEDEEECDEEDDQE